MRNIRITGAIASLVLVASLLFSNVSFATPVNHTSNESKLQKKLKEYQETQQQVKALQKKIASTDQRLSNTFEELEKLNDEQTKTQKRLNQILVHYYTSGQHQMEAQLLNSQSISEFIFRLELIRLSVERDYKVLNKYKQRRKQITKKKEQLHRDLTKLKPVLTQTEQKTKQLEKQYQTLVTEIKKQKKQPKSNQPSPNMLPRQQQVSNQAWLNKARSMIGTVKYVFGAQNYPYFDCSSWTQYVFRTYRGIQLPRTAEAQSKVGISVSKNNLQPGDLVFFQGTYKKGISHVGIYLGNGNIISNKNSKLDLQMESLHSTYSKKHYWGAKRVNN